MLCPPPGSCHLTTLVEHIVYGRPKFSGDNFQARGEGSYETPPFSGGLCYRPPENFPCPPHNYLGCGRSGRLGPPPPPRRRVSFPPPPSRTSLPLPRFTYPDTGGHVNRPLGLLTIRGFPHCTVGAPFISHLRPRAILKAEGSPHHREPANSFFYKDGLVFLYVFLYGFSSGKGHPPGGGGV